MGEEEDGSRVLICACGPEGMMTDVREGVAGALGEYLGMSVEMHLEAFGW